MGLAGAGSWEAATCERGTVNMLFHRLGNWTPVRPAGPWLIAFGFNHPSRTQTVSALWTLMHSRQNFSVKCHTVTILGTAVHTAFAAVP